MNKRFNKEKHFPLLVLLFVFIVWGSNFVASDYLLMYISPIMLSLTKLAFGSVFLMIVVFIKDRRLKIEKKDWPRFFVCGAMGMSIYLNLESTGIVLTSASVAALIMATMPIWGMIADRIIYKRKITPRKILGIIGSVIGVTILIMGNPSVDIKGSLFGVFCMFLAAFFWLGYILLLKPLNEKYDLITITTGVFISGTIVSFIQFVFIPQAKSIFTPSVIIVLVVTTIISLIFCQICYVYALGKLSITTVTIFENMLPLISIIFSYLIFKETLTQVQFLGGFAILISVTVISLSEQANHND